MTYKKLFKYFVLCLVIVLSHTVFLKAENISTNNKDN